MDPQDLVNPSRTHQSHALARDEPRASEVVLDSRTIENTRCGHPMLSGLLPVAAGFLPVRDLDIPKPPPGSHARLFLYCVRGSAWCQAAGRLHAFAAGDLLTLPEKDRHALRTNARDPATIHWVQAIGAHLEDYVALMGVTAAGPIVHVGDDPQIARLFSETLRALRHGSSALGLLQASTSFAYLLALVAERCGHAHPPNPGTTRKVAEAIVFMSEHLERPPQISALARAAGLSPAYFGELFKQQTGCSPRQYLRLLRMHKACQLLSESTRSIKQIAGCLGYNDAFHFSREFKAFEGVPPTEYRRRLS